MARYVINDKISELMKVREGVLSQESWKALNRRYSRMSRELIALFEEGKVSSTSPMKMTEEDVKAFIVYRKERKVSASDLKHDISALKQLLMFCGNGVVQTAMFKYPGLKPVEYQERLDPLPDSVYDALFELFDRLDKRDFRGTRAVTLIALYTATGCRNKELRLANLTDLDTRDWTLRIFHPKGEGTYGKARTVRVPEEVRPMVKRYLKLRESWLISHKYDEPGPLFFAMTSERGHLSSNSIRKIKETVAAKLGVDFELRDCRRAYGQRYINNGARIEAVSMSMGHKNIGTTTKYYAGITNRMAIAELDGKWSRSSGKDTVSDCEEGDE